MKKLYVVLILAFGAINTLLAATTETDQASYTLTLQVPPLCFIGFDETKDGSGAFSETLIASPSSDPNHKYAAVNVDKKFLAISNMPNYKIAVSDNSKIDYFKSRITFSNETNKDVNYEASLVGYLTDDQNKEDQIKYTATMTDPTFDKTGTPTFQSFLHLEVDRPSLDAAPIGDYQGKITLYLKCD